MAGNQTMTIVAEMLNEVVERAVTVVSQDDGDEGSLATRRRGVRSQERLAALVEAGDADAAEEHWRTHMTVVGRVMLGQKAKTRRRPPRPLLMTDDADWRRRAVGRSGRPAADRSVDRGMNLIRAAVTVLELARTARTSPSRTSPMRRGSRCGRSTSTSRARTTSSSPCSRRRCAPTRR